MFSTYIIYIDYYFFILLFTERKTCYTSSNSSDIIVPSNNSCGNLTPGDAILNFFPLCSFGHPHIFVVSLKTPCAHGLGQLSCPVFLSRCSVTFLNHGGNVPHQNHPSPTPLAMNLRPGPNDRIYSNISISFFNKIQITYKH